MQGMNYDDKQGLGLRKDSFAITLLARTTHGGPRRTNNEGGYSKPQRTQRVSTSTPGEATRLNERARPRRSTTPALSTPDYRPGRALLIGRYTIGERGRGGGRVTRALPYFLLTADSLLWALRL